MNMTYHAETRCQQRGIPPLILQWLDLYGEEQYDGKGAVIRYFSRSSRRAMEKDFGRSPVKKLKGDHYAYFIKRSDFKI